MKTSMIALLFLALVGSGGYWLQQSGKLAEYWPGFSAATSQQSQQPAQKPQAGGNRGPTPVEVADAKQTRLSDSITAIGTLLSDASADIAPETSGRVVEILFQDGAAVKQGDILFKLDAELTAAQVADAEANLALAEATFKRNDALRKTRNVAQSIYDESATALTLAKTAVTLARVTLSKLSIRAPFDGTAGFSKISTGAYVAAGTPLVHLEKIDKLKVSFSVPELQFARLSTGQTVTLTADAVPGESFTAAVTAVDPLVDVNGRALRVLAGLDNTKQTLRPGMLTRVTVQGPSREAVTVPESAIVPRGETSIVFVAEEDVVKQAIVKTGKRSDGTIEITEGLSAGSKVVVAGNTRLSDGATIKIVPPPAAN